MLYAKGEAPTIEEESDGSDVLNALNAITSQDEITFTEAGESIAVASALKAALATKTPAELVAAESRLTSKMFGDLVQEKSGFLNYCIFLGQSLVVGGTAAVTAPINTAAVEGAYVFNGVPVTGPLDTQAVDADDVASIVPMTQTTKETLTYTLIKGLIDTVGGTWLAGVSGRGGKKLSEINKGTEPYNNGKTMAAAVVARAADIGLVPITKFAVMVHGESDSSAGTLLDFYEADYSANYSDVLDDFTSVIDSNTPPMFMTQIGITGSQAFAARELDIATKHPAFYMCGPNWPIERTHPSLPTDYTHPAPEGYVILGNMIKRAVLEVMYKNQADFKSIRPIGIEVSNRQAKVIFHVPEGNLVIDKETFGAAPGLGIRYKYTNLQGVVATVAVLGNPVISGNTVTFSFTEPLAAGGYIEAGDTLTDHSGTNDIPVPLINLRGSVPTIDSTSGKDWYDWCPQFNYPITVNDGALSAATSNLWYFGSFYITRPSDNYALIAGTDSLYFLDGATYQVDYVSANIISGTCKIWVGDDSHTIAAGGGSLIMTRGAARRLRLQSGATGFVGRVNDIRVKKLT